MDSATTRGMTGHLNNLTIEMEMESDEDHTLSRKSLCKHLVFQEFHVSTHMPGSQKYPHLYPLFFIIPSSGVWAAPKGVF